MFCYQCGKEIDENAEVCPFCGAPKKMDSAPTEKKRKSFFQKSSFINDFIDARIAKLSEVNWDKGFDKAEGVAKAIGIWGYYLLALISLFAFPIIASKAEMTGTGILAGLIVPLFSIMFAYGGTKLYGSIRNLIDNVPSSVSSMNSINVIAVFAAVFSVVGCVACFVACGNTMIQFWLGEDSSTFAIAGVVFLVFGAYTCLMLIGSKKLLGVKEEKCGSAEEFLGIFTMFFKMGARLTPFIWCVGAFVAVLLELVALVSGGEDAFAFSGIAVAVAVFTGIFPLLVYINYLIYNFMLDFAKSILSIPGKIDTLKK